MVRADIAGDMNGDCVVNGLDIQLFVEKLLKQGNAVSGRLLQR